MNNNTAKLPPIYLDRENIFASALHLGGPAEIDRRLAEMLFPDCVGAPTPQNLNRMATARMMIAEHRVAFSRDTIELLKAATQANKRNEEAIEAMREFHGKMQGQIKELESDARQAREARGIYVSKELEIARNATLAAELHGAQLAEVLQVKLSEAKRINAETEELLRIATREVEGLRHAMQLQETTTGQLMRAMAEDNDTARAVLAKIAAAEELFQERYGNKAPPFHAFAWKHITEAKALLAGEPVKVNVAPAVAEVAK